MTELRRLRTRRAVSVGVAVAVVGVVGVGFVLSTADPADSPTATEPTATEPTVTEPTVTEPTATEPTVTEPTVTTWTPPADDPSQPSPAAVAADREFRVAPQDLVDCGVHVRTSGWPTTAVFGTGLLDCILDAAATGTPAQFVTTARDFTGGMEGTIFRVLGADQIVAIDYRADPTGVITSTESSCTALSEGNYPVPECL